MSEQTPLMRQYWEIKNQHLDKVVLFRMGDFYEMFHGDAEQAAPILGIQLTSRNKKAKDETKMCGVPYHSIATPIAKLLAQGLKVAIAEQVEDPKLAKGLVKRAVTRVLTPGMVYDPETLDQVVANYMACYDEKSLSFLENSTGEAFYYWLDSVEDRNRLLQLLSPSEIVVFRRDWKTSSNTFFPFEPDAAEKLPASAQCLLDYIREMQGPGALKTLGTFEQRQLGHHMRVGQQTLVALEIFENSRGEKNGTLFESFRKFKTAAGGRLFRSWLQFPLTQREAIESRQRRIARWLESTAELETVRNQLAEVGDIERKLAKVSSPTATPRDLKGLQLSMQAALGLHGINGADFSRSLVERMERTLVDEPPASLKEGGWIRSGFDSRLDEIQSLAAGANQRLLDLEIEERAATGISSLKIRFNSVFGFYIEVTTTHLSKVPSHYIRKQTLANAERFITPGLQDLESRVLAAQAQQVQIETQIFEDLRSEVLRAGRDLLQWSREVAELDTLTTLAWLALERKYVRPEIFESGDLILGDCRHPVLELSHKKGFTPNSIRVAAGECILLTGPNMAGKSTLMRQVALISLLAQTGSYVPAASARVPLIDGIYTRIGASDALDEGLSTFMVEMTETATILRSATSRSLILLDEIGRGTATEDGVSLAQALLEYLLVEKSAYLLFTTHYHELTALADRFKNLKNMHMDIRESGGEIHFLHTLKVGAAEKSYGIHVAKLAGLPPSILHRASQLLNTLVAKKSMVQQEFVLDPDDSAKVELETLKRKILERSVNTLTPVEALVTIESLQRELLEF
jgi:DNA mismatch repair protein MutS